MHCHTECRAGGREWEERERRKDLALKWFVEVRDRYMEAVDGLA